MMNNSIFGNSVETSNNLSGLFRGKATLVVESLVIRMTGTFNDQYLRPYVTNPNLNNNDFNRMATSIADSAANSGIITPMAVAGNGSNFLTRSASPDSAASIVNGWGTQRLRYLMRVKVQSSIGTSNTLFVSGYTDHAGVMNGTLDPDMVFYVNTMTKTRTTMFQTPMGRSSILEQVGSQQYATDHSIDNGGYNFNNHGGLRLMTPVDIYSALETAPLYRASTDPNNPNSFSDRRFIVDASGKAAARNLNTSSNYIANTLNSYINGISDNTQEREYSSALEHYKKSNEFEGQDLWKNEFFAAINYHKNNHESNTNHFTLRDLMKVDFQTMDKITFIKDLPGELHSAGNTSHWNGQDLNTVSAVTIASSVAELMSEQLISRISFTSSNSTINGQPYTEIAYGEGFSNTSDMTQNYERFKLAFEFLIAKDITFNNELNYMVHVQVDLMGQTFIKIRMDGQPEQDFVYPTFCDALTSPIVTTNMSNILNVSEDFSSLMTYVKDATYNKMPNLAAGINF